MKKFSVAMIAAAIVMGLSAPTFALPPFNAAFQAKYPDLKEKTDVAKCNVCHDANSKSKKDKNEYGKAVGTILTKAKFEEVKADKEAASKWIAEGLDKAAELKNAAGKTYGELIKAGELPGG